MKVIVEGIGSFGNAVQLELHQLLTPDTTGKHSDRDLATVIGKLGALLVVRGVCTIEEAQKVCGVEALRVIGKPIMEKKS